MFGYRFKKIDTDNLILKSNCNIITFLYFCKIFKKTLKIRVFKTFSFVQKMTTTIYREFSWQCIYMVYLVVACL